MKLCLICGHVDRDGAPCCPKCGEASWSELSDPKPAEKPRKAPKPQKGEG